MYHSLSLNKTRKHADLSAALEADLKNFPKLTAYLAVMSEECKEHLAARANNLF